MEFCRKLSEFLGKFPDILGSLSNSLTFPGVPCQWQPCKSVTFQQFFNWFCFVPLWFSLSHDLASWEGSLVLAFYGQNKTDQMWLVCLQVQVEFRCQHWSWGRTGALPLLGNNEIFVKKTIQNISLENKCKMSEKQLEQLANLYAYNLKKSQSLIGHFLLRLSSYGNINKHFFEDGRNRGCTLPARNS